MRVKLIVTGSMEKRALHHSLARCFSRTGAGEPIEFLPPSMSDGLTGNRLDEPNEHVPEFVRKFANALAAETLAGSEPRAKPPDLVVGVDDLELANAHQPQVVTGWVRRGVEDFFVRNPANIRTLERQRAALRSRCSFHLLVPMPEAYFFGERAALTRAGVAQNIGTRMCNEELEAFETDDPEFVPRADHPEDRRHPKRYLEHLLRRSGRPLVRPYRETRDGVRALEALAWPELSDNAHTLAFARALFEDLSGAFGLPNPLGEGALAPSTHPRDRRRLILRNI